MVTMPTPPVPATDPHPRPTRSAQRRAPRHAPLLAAGWLLGAAVALAGVGLIGRRLGASAQVGMTFLNAAVVLLAACGVMIPVTRSAALLLVWNGLGVALSLLAIGLFRLGALIALPVILIALGLSAWPREDGESLVSVPALIALTGGALVLPAAYALTRGFGWIADVAG